MGGAQFVGNRTEQLGTDRQDAPLLPRDARLTGAPHHVNLGEGSKHDLHSPDRWHAVWNEKHSLSLEGPGSVPFVRGATSRAGDPRSRTRPGPVPLSRERRSTGGVAARYPFRREAITPVHRPRDACSGRRARARIVRGSLLLLRQTSSLRVPVRDPVSLSLSSTSGRRSRICVAREAEAVSPGATLD